MGLFGSYAKFSIGKRILRAVLGMFRGNGAGRTASRSSSRRMRL